MWYIEQWCSRRLIIALQSIHAVAFLLSYKPLSFVVEKHGRDVLAARWDPCGWDMSNNPWLKEEVDAKGLKLVESILLGKGARPN